MPPHPPATDTNHLLAALPPRERRRFLGGCRPIDLAVSDVLASSGERIRRVYFPIAGSVSQTTPEVGGANLEVGLVGNEGMLGLPLVLGIDVSPLRAVVQGRGSALRMDAAPFRRQLAANPALLGLLNRYFFVLMQQLAQAAACTRFHLVEARLARLLLMTQDRANAGSVRMTHEVLSRRLGVRRAGVTVAAASLQRRALISYRRGDITILDRGGLEATACECYAMDGSIYSRIMGGGRRRGSGADS